METASATNPPAKILRPVSGVGRNEVQAASRPRPPLPSGWSMPAGAGDVVVAGRVPLGRLRLRWITCPDGDGAGCPVAVGQVVTVAVGRPDGDGDGVPGSAVADGVGVGDAGESGPGQVMARPETSPTTAIADTRAGGR